MGLFTVYDGKADVFQSAQQQPVAEWNPVQQFYHYHYRYR